MTIELSMPELTELHPRITVMGVGGAGGNAVNNMIRSKLQGVSFVVANTDAQALALSECETRIQLGREITEGLGAGSKPDVGARAAEEAIGEIEQHLDGCHMLFLAAGMGGGTGTGAAPIIAARARERGILTVGVVTKPFHFEGSRRMRLADAGIAELQKHVDTLIIIPNQNLFRVANERTTFQDAFAMADQVLHSGVRGITDLMMMPGLINLDFADVRTVMSEMGNAMMGTGEAEGENRAIEAADAAISNPLLDEVSLKGAKGVLVNITGGLDLTLYEVDQAAEHIRSQADEDAIVMFGSAFSESLNGQIRVSVVATGITPEAGNRERSDDRPRASVVSISSHRSQGAVAPSARARAEAEMTRSHIENPPPPPGSPVFEPEAPALPADSESMTMMDAAKDSSEEEEALLLSEPVGNTRSTAGEDGERAGFAANAASDHAEETFIAPAPRLPGDGGMIGRTPDPFAEAAFENGVATRSLPAEDAPAPRNERRLGLFRRMAKIGEQSATDIPERPAGGTGLSLGGLRPDDRPVPATRSEEQLEIPAFLRRQAN